MQKICRGVGVRGGKFKEKRDKRRNRDTRLLRGLRACPRNCRSTARVRRTHLSSCEKVRRGSFRKNQYRNEQARIFDNRRNGVRREKPAGSRGVHSSFVGRRRRRNRPPHHRSADKKLYGSGTRRQKRKGRPVLCRKQRGAHKVRQIFRRRENRNRAVRRKSRPGRQNAAFARDDFSRGGNCDKHGEKGRLYRVLARVSGEKRYARRDNIDRLRRRTPAGVVEQGNDFLQRAISENRRKSFDGQRCRRRGRRRRENYGRSCRFRRRDNGHGRRKPRGYSAV